MTLFYWFANTVLMLLVAISSGMVGIKWRETGGVLWTSWMPVLIAALATLVALNVPH